MKSTTLTASFLLTEPTSCVRLVHPESKLRVVFLGTPAFAARFLEGLITDPYFEIVGVVTQQDEVLGRKKLLTPPPVKALALEKCIPVFQPAKMNEPSFLEAIANLKADVFVIVAFGRILPEALLNIPPLGSINVHPSLLPLWRGPSPIIAAIANGDTKTGVSIMKIDAAMDHGPLLAQKEIAISKDETTESLTEQVVHLGSPLLNDTLKTYHAGKLPLVEQDHNKATYCKLLTREDGIIDWHESAEQIERKVRAYNPWPGTATTWKKGDEPIGIKIFSVQFTDKQLSPGEIVINGSTILVGTSTSALQIIELQPSGGKRMQAADFVRGYGDSLAQ